MMLWCQYAEADIKKPFEDDDVTQRWPMPPVTTTDDGNERRVGVEVEYVGVELKQTAEIIAKIWNGTVVWQHDQHAEIDCGDLGAFVVELDVSWMQKLSKLAQEERESDGLHLAETASRLLLPLINEVAPNEIVTPPLPLSQLKQMDRLTDAMRKAGAKGTKDSILYAFGVHLNPETPSTKPEVVLSYIRAFILLYDWMKYSIQIDATRQFTGFAKSFPMRYARMIMDPHYQPGMPQLIDDYLKENPTRNRALDMLPLFAHMDDARVRAKVHDALVKPRPTYHFRMPNCRIDEAGWGIADAWKSWLHVERLAYDPEGLQTLQAKFLTCHDLPTHYFSDEWLNITTQWILENHASA